MHPYFGVDTFPPPSSGAGHPCDSRDSDEWYQNLCLLSVVVDDPHPQLNIPSE
jgi:hypothetical protein